MDNVPLPVRSTSNNTSGQKKKSVSFDWVKSDIEATTVDLSPVFDSEEHSPLQYFKRYFDTNIIEMVVDQKLLLCTADNFVSEHKCK